MLPWFVLHKEFSGFRYFHLQCLVNFCAQEFALISDYPAGQRVLKFHFVTLTYMHRQEDGIDGFSIETPVIS